MLKKKIKALLLMLSLFVAGFVVAPALADSTSINFESPTYTTGSISGQNGWSGAVNPSIDQEVVANTYGYGSFGGQTFRMSNAYTNGSFGDWVFTKPLTDEAGETIAENDGMSGGIKQPYFEASWDFASAVPGAEQPGLQLSVSPDRGDGARMSYIKMSDHSDGLSVDFYDYQSGVNEVGCVAGTNFILTNITSGLDRTAPHNVKLTMQFVDGPNNDIVKVYLDGILKHTGTSWEGYFNECEGNPTRTVDSLIIQARESAGTAIDTDGEGFLIDNISLFSGPIPVDPFAVPAECSAITGLGAPIVGTSGSDNINGTGGNDLIFALGGSDRVNGKGGDDCIVGGAGSDSISAAGGNDVVLGGDGSDSIDGAGGDDDLYGQGASDSIRGGGGEDMLSGGAGADSLRGEGGPDTIDGGAGSDSANGGGGTDTCSAESETSCEL